MATIHFDPAVQWASENNLLYARISRVVAAWYREHTVFVDELSRRGLITIF